MKNNLEEIVLSKISDEQRKSYEKYKELGLLIKGGNILNNVYLSDSYDNFANFLLGVDKLRFGKLDFTVLFIPITKRFNEMNLSNNPELIYNKFKEWYDEEGQNCNDNEESIKRFTEFFYDFKNSCKK